MLVATVSGVSVQYYVSARWYSIAYCGGGYHGLYGSGSDAFKKSATGELLDSVDIDIDLPDTDFKTPQAIKDIGNALVSGAEAVGDVVEDILT